MGRNCVRERVVCQHLRDFVLLPRQSFPGLPQPNICSLGIKSTGKQTFQRLTFHVHNQQQRGKKVGHQLFFFASSWGKSITNLLAFGNA